MKKLFFALLPLLLLFVGIRLSRAGDVGVSLDEAALQWKDVIMSSTEMDTLNATPITAVVAPGTGKVSAIDKVFCWNDFSSTPFELGSGTLDVRYSNGSGSLAAQFANEFVEAQSDAYGQAYGRDVLTYGANQALVFYASADVTAGNGTMKCRVYYKVLTLSDI